MVQNSKRLCSTKRRRKRSRASSYFQLPVKGLENKHTTTIMSRKTIYLLLGQKGSGKSYIGSIFQQSFGIAFIRVEDWVKSIKKERSIDNEAYLQQAFEVIEQGIRQQIQQRQSLVFESTGLTNYFDAMLQRLKQDGRLVTIGIDASADTCLQRVHSRDQRIHINVSDEQVMMINARVREKNLLTDFRIENEAKSEHELINEIGKIIDAIEGESVDR